MRTVPESYRGGAAVTPSDTDEIRETRALYVETSGDLALVMSNGDELTLTGVTAKEFLPIAVKQVKSTDTTASGIIAFY